MTAAPTPLRLLVALLAIAGALTASALLAGHAEHILHQAPAAGAPASATNTHMIAPPVPPRRLRRTATARPWRADRPSAGLTSTRLSVTTANTAGVPPRAAPGARARHGGGLVASLGGGGLMLLVGGEVALGVGIVGGLLGTLCVRRVRLRARREYAVYEVHLSTHDEAKPQDLQDMLEQVANIVRAFPAERFRSGQPYVALELICSRVGEGMEWSVNLRCQPQAVRALDGAIGAAYPDVRVGHTHAEAPTPRPGGLREPGCVMRFRKQRSFIYPLIAPGELLGSPPLEQIARAQVQLAVPSVVRFQLTPTPTWFEELARRRHRGRERRLAGAIAAGGDRRGGVVSTLNRQEMSNATGAQNRSLFWLEVVVAADTAEACKTVAAAMAARRGENRLQRRAMVVRQGLYRRRFPRGLGPLIPSTRSLVSAAEAAHLLALPSARMKGVPLRRLTLPRIPAAPQAGRSQPPPEQLHPMLRAENAEVLVLPEDRRYGALLVGGQGAGKTSALLRFYLNDIEDPHTAPLVIDPKPELAHLCLKLTPPDCPKSVWYLDLAHPAFGMNPLRLVGDRPLPIEAAQVAENIVAALLDINENQIFQSSRRYLYHAVIGAIAHAQKEGRRARFEDVYTLLLPAKADFRSAVAQACADQPDLDQTAAFFSSELPGELGIAGAATAQRLDAPRNKIAGLTQVPALRRFFNHPTDIPLREIIEAHDILLVDANMGAIGQENSKACMHFILRALHTQMQRQVHLPEHQRPRVPLLVDEAHYVLGAENVIDQFATHRRAGLEAACGLQYFAQLGSGSVHEQKIRKGALNLLQSRFLFRMGDAQDAEEAARIAMAVYSSMIRDDPDSRARLRVTPEQLLNFPNHYCLASWIADGTRIPSFIGQTYPLPDVGDQWAQHHLAAQAQRVAPYPEQLESTLDATTTRANQDRPAGDAATPAGDTVERPSRRATTTPKRPRAADAEPPPRPGSPADAPDEGPARPDPQPTDTGPGFRTRPDRGARTPSRREVQVDYEPPAQPPDLTDSPVRRVVGVPAKSAAPVSDGQPAPDTLRELAFLDRIIDIAPAEQLDGSSELPRLHDDDYAILALLDRAGLVPPVLIGRAVLPGRAPRTVRDRLAKLYRHGLIAHHATTLRGHGQQDGKPPTLCSLTRRGLQVAQQRQPAPAISPRREWRAIEQTRAARLSHDLHALAWGIQLHRLAGPLATDHWRTPRYTTGRYPVPQAGGGRDRHPIALSEIPVPDGQAIIDVQLKTFMEVKPDLSLELRIPSMKLTFDLLVELDLTARASYNRDKFLAYDAFLCGWSLAHHRYQAQGTRPVVVFVCPDARAALALAREADEAMTGRIGTLGAAPEHWYHPGRDHTLFAVEADIHHGRLPALMLEPTPPALRERLTGSRHLRLQPVELLDGQLVKHGHA